MKTTQTFESTVGGKDILLPGASLLLVESIGDDDDDDDNVERWRRVGFMSVSVPADPEEGDLNVAVLKEMEVERWGWREIKLV